MGDKKIFTQNKNSVSSKLLKVLGIVAITALFFYFVTKCSNTEVESKVHPEKGFNTSVIQQNHEENIFLGLDISQNTTEKVLSLQFTKLETSNVIIEENDETIKITVDNVKNTADYNKENYLINNLLMEVHGDTMLFIINKDQLKSRYLIAQTENSIDIKLLSKSLQGKRITIDPGHGGMDSGAVGPTGLMEKTAVLPVALRLAELLEAEGAEVILTRYTDDRAIPDYKQDQINRLVVAQEFDSHMFISIHNNGSDFSSAQGIEVLYNENTVNSYQSIQLAEIVQKNLVDEFQRRDRGIVDRNIIQLRGQSFTSVLAEIMFITNPEEEKMIGAEDFTEKAAQSLFLAIKEYFES